MANLNQVALCGHLFRDPGLRWTPVAPRVPLLARRHHELTPHRHEA